MTAGPCLKSATIGNGGDAMGASGDCVLCGYGMVEPDACTEIY